MIYEEQEFDSIIKKAVSIKTLEFIDCTFTNCTIEECDINDCSFKHCTFKKCTIINNDFSSSYSINNTFEKCTLLGINWKNLIHDSYIHYTFLTIQESILKYNVFYQLKLKRFNFSNNDLTGTLIQENDLENNTFVTSNLIDTIFNNSNFKKAINYYIDPITNTIGYVKFSFSEAIKLLAAFKTKIE